MDRQNRSDLFSFFNNEDDRIICLRDYDPTPDTLDVPDPYYGGPEGFIEVFDIIDRSMRELLDHVEARLL
jgi:protein-tyrosine phosphatase